MCFIQALLFVVYYFFLQNHQLTLSTFSANYRIFIFFKRHRCFLSLCSLCAKYWKNECNSSENLKHKLGMRQPLPQIPLESSLKTIRNNRKCFINKNKLRIIFIHIFVVMFSPVLAGNMLKLVASNYINLCIRKCVLQRNIRWDTKQLDRIRMPRWVWSSVLFIRITH